MILRWPVAELLMAGARVASAVLAGGIDERRSELVGIDNGAAICSAPAQIDPR